MQITAVSFIKINLKEGLFMTQNEKFELIIKTLDVKKGEDI